MLFEVALLAMTSPQAGNSGQSNVQSVTTPKPIEGMWAFYRVGDTPVNADGSAKHGVVRIAITIDAAGIPQSCKIVISSGDRTLDKSSCLSALARGKFLPAKDEQSRSITSILPTTVTWGAAPRGSQDAELSRADAVFSVERLPNDKNIEFEIFEIVDSTGVQLSCGSDNDSVDVRYKNAACKNIGTLKNRLSGFVGQPPNKIMIVSRVLFTSKPMAPSKQENGRIYNVERQN